MLNQGNGELYGASSDWTDLIPVDLLFNEESLGEGLDLVNRVTRLAQNGAHVLYPSISATSSESSGLNFSVTLDTAIRVNRNLLQQPKIGESERSFRVELDALFESKRALAH